MVLGSALHSGFEAHHRAKDAEMALLRRWRDAVSVVGQVDFGSALAALERYQRHNPRQPNDRPEVKFNLPLPGLPVTLFGYIDLMRGSEVHELKSCRAAKTWSQERADTELQGTAYWWAFSQLRQRDPNHVVYHAVPLDGSEPQRYYTHRSPDQVEEFLALLCRVYGEMSDAANLKPGCVPSRCEFKEHCPAYRGTTGSDRDGAAGGVLAPAPEWPSLRVDR